MKRTSPASMLPVCAVLALLFGCGVSPAADAQADDALPPAEATITAPADSAGAQHAELAKIYTRAISDFINAAYETQNSTFDTLYFGKRANGQPDDFPDIQLPAAIGNTQIRLISPQEGEKKQSQRKSSVYVNMMGWVDHVSAEFMLVVFCNGFAHQYDYFLQYTAKANDGEMQLFKIEFEDFRHRDDKSSQRKTIWSDGRYLISGH